VQGDGGGGPGYSPARGGLVSSRGRRPGARAGSTRGWSVADGIRIDDLLAPSIFGATVLREGDVITIDGGSGAGPRLGSVSTEDAGADEIGELLAWVDEIVGGAPPADA